MQAFVSRRARTAAVGAVVVLAIGLFPLAAGVAAADPSVTPISGGTGIQSNTARIGGTGAWTTLTGPVIVEGEIGQWTVGETITLGLPANFEWNTTRRTAPIVANCARSSSVISYSPPNATITLNMKTGPSLGSLCRVDFGTTLQVRPVSSSLAVGSGGIVGLTFVDPALPMPGVFPGGAGRVSMVQSQPPVVTPAAGGTGIPSNTAASGGSGAWTTLTGPTITESAIGQFPVDEQIKLDLPTNFQWNPSRTSAPSVTGCDKAASSIAYSGDATATITIKLKSGPVQGSVCRIDFGSTLQVRPLSSSMGAGSGGTIGLSFDDPATTMLDIFLAGAGQVSMVSSPVGSLALSATSPTMNNNAINWGEYVDLITTGTAATQYQMQVTTDNVTWETLKDSAGSPITFTIGSGGTYAYRYTPIRNYWYRSVAGSTMSNSPRVTVRQTISLRPTNGGKTKTISKGTSIAFTATVRPARPELQKANVAFEVWQKSGGSWVRVQTATKTIDSNGIASWSWSASSAGSFYVRAQAQPTPVNANSFWTPNEYYTVQ